MNIERHPLEPFVPAGAKILMLRSFPPARERWSMEFYYPNFINDMWRIFGLIFFGNKDHFLRPGIKKFDKERIISLLNDKGIALFDSATAVIRTKNNASDKFLEIVEKTDIRKLLSSMPECRAVVSTGHKSSECICDEFEILLPKIGEYSEFRFKNKTLRFYRMPSSSRAYPKPLQEKAEVYAKLFRGTGIL